jgi:hypothetical protein
MAVGVTSGYYVSGATTNSYGANFVPEIWSGKLQVKFYKSTVLGEITNNDWEGEIKSQGDKVYIRTIPTITISDYTKGMSLANQVPISTPITLTIDNGKYFSVVVDDVDEVQADVKLMDMFTNDAAQQMKIAIDGLVLTALATGGASSTPLAATANKGAYAGAISGDGSSAGINLGTTAAPVTLTKSNVLDTILNMGQALDEQNVPEEGRWLVVPAWMGALIKNSDLKQAYLTGDDTSILRNGKMGMIDRFTLYVSNNLYTASQKTTIVAGTRDAVSFASQITNVETLRSTTTFGNIMRGLNVFGYKVVKPEALVAAVVTK